MDAKNTVELYRTMETNIIGLCLVTREAVRLMKKRDEEVGSIGHIVNINSIFGHKIHACVPGTKVRPTENNKQIMRELIN